MKFLCKMLCVLTIFSLAAKGGCACKKKGPNTPKPQGTEGDGNNTENDDTTHYPAPEDSYTITIL